MSDSKWPAGLVSTPAIIGSGFTTKDCGMCQPHQDEHAIRRRFSKDVWFYWVGGGHLFEAGAGINVVGTLPEM